MTNDLTFNTNLKELEYLDFSEQIEEYERKEKIIEYYDLSVLETEADKIFCYAKTNRIKVNKRNFYSNKYHGYFVKKRKVFVLYKNNLLQNLIVCWTVEDAEKIYKKISGYNKGVLQ